MESHCQELYNTLERAVLYLDKSLIPQGEIAYLLIEEKVSPCSSPLVSLARRICEGNFASALLEDNTALHYILSLFREKLDEHTKPHDLSLILQDTIEMALLQHNKLDFHLSVLWTGVSALMLFVQSNWTGPLISQSSIQEQCLKLIPLLDNTIAIQALGIDGELLYRGIHLPQCLLLADSILLRNNYHLQSCQSASWWSARCAGKYQEILSGPSESIRKLIKTEFSKAIFAYPSVPEVLLESALASINSFNLNDAYDAILKTQNCTGLICKLTGVMAKATKYQTTDKAQLVLFAKSASSLHVSLHSNDPEYLHCSEAVLSDSAKQDECLVGNSFSSIEIQDDETDIRLKNLSLSDTQDADFMESNLSEIDQCIIIALCLEFKNKTPGHRLTWEQMSAYIQRVLKNPNNWMVHSTALLIKARLESHGVKYMDRAALQIQVLVDQFNEEDSARDYPALVRCKRIFQVSFPPLFRVKLEIAQIYLKLGVFRHAKQLFRELEVWKELIECMIICDEEQKAAEIINERIQIEGRTPELVCLLADLNKDLECKKGLYCESLNISNGSYTRARRELGKLAMACKDYDSAIEHFQRSLDINSQYGSIWFRLGYCALETSNWKLAQQAFAKVTSLHPDDAEAWSNLASAFLKSNQIKSAHYALKEALKRQPENWRIWQNFLITCVYIGSIQEAIHTLNQLLELKQTFDIDVLNKLVSILTDHYLNDSSEALRVRSQFQTLLGRISSQISNNSNLWAVYAKYYQAVQNTNKVVEFRQKQCRSLQRYSWEKELDKVECVVECFLLLVDSIEIAKDVSAALSTKLQLRSMLKRIGEHFADSSAYELLKSTEPRLEAIV